MIKGRRILAVVLALVMTVSLGMVSTVYAAAPLQFEGATTVLFDQNFGGIKNAAGAPDFTIYGSNWTYASHFIMNAVDNEPYVQTKDNYDLSDASGFEFEVKMEVTSNSNTITLPGNYRVRWNNSKVADVGNTAKALTLLKGTEVLGYKVIDLYDADTVYKVKYVDGLWTVSATTKTASASFTYEDASNPTFNGKFKVGCSYTGHYTVYYMKLTKFANTATVNHWNYSTDFKSTDNRDDYVNEGLTLPSGAKFYNGYATTGSNVSTTFAPYGNKLSGDYNFAAEISGINENAMYIRFNYVDSKNYYELFIYHKAGAIDVSDKTGYPAGDGYVLRKNTGGTLSVLDVVDLDGTSFESSSTKCLYSFDVTNTTEGRKIDVTVTTGNSSLRLDALDSSPFADNGNVVIKQSYTGTSTKLYRVTASSLVSDSDKASDKTIKYLNVEIDKVFSTEDTRTSLIDEGITLSANPSSIDETNGIYWKSNAYTMTYTNASAIAKSYVMKTSMYRDNNNAKIYFNYLDSSNHYCLDAQYNSSSMLMTLKKVKDGQTTDLGEYTFGSSAAAGRGVWTDVTVEVTKNSDGSLDISTLFDNNTITKKMSYTDNDPVISGNSVKVEQGWAGVVKIKSFSVVTFDEGSSSWYDGNKPIYTGRFFDSQGFGLTTPVNGVVYFEYPVALFGNYKVIATLHESNKMTGIKVISPLELYSGKVRLFNISDAKNAKVRVYFFDGEETLNRIAEVYELN